MQKPLRVDGKDNILLENKVMSFPNNRSVGKNYCSNKCGRSLPLTDVNCRKIVRTSLQRAPHRHLSHHALIGSAWMVTERMWHTVRESLKQSVLCRYRGGVLEKLKFTFLRTN